MLSLCPGRCNNSLHTREGSRGKRCKRNLEKDSGIEGVPDAKDPIALPANVGFDENYKMLFDEVVNNFGHIDILVNN
ncbi:hypothetical protein CDL12_10818 [Handroanthus impetiginosus]|uniref:Uncharacterized protein n=1 Tax=Handroanthus impetiginosus TaxID=429701 RepID=A0A2G9HG44_9LAMI|nr:hypothetical protein CDL12_10818 [Handroanthus impetiginosus]